MSSINGLGGPSPIQNTPALNPKSAPVETSATPARASDRLELSGVSHLLQSLKTNDVRTDKVANIKAQIASGSYDADGTKLDASLDGLLDDLSK